MLQIPRLSNNTNQQSSANMQSDLLARSGFQPYRPDERHLHPAGAPFTMDSFSPFGHIPGLPTSKLRNSIDDLKFKLTDSFDVLGGLFNPAALSYPEALYLDPRLQSMLRSNPHALYSQLASPYASHLYGLMPGAPQNLSGLHERMKLEEEHRNRIAREEEKVRMAREEEKQRERERELREKEMREREQREKEMREREQREKEMRDRELRELREKEMRDREQREKDLREREMREKEIRERDKLLQQHHYMQSQRHSYNLLGLFPQMVGLRPPSSMHPGYPMHHSLLGLPLPSQIPTSLSSNLSMSHHSQPPQSGSSSVPITSTSNMSLMPPIGASGSLMGLNHSGHGMPHGLSLYPGSLPPPAHLYSPLAPPSASPSGLSNSYNHPMMNPATSPQPISRSPSSMSTQQSLNLSKNPMLSSPYTSKGLENRNASDVMKNASSTNTPTQSSIATVSVSSMSNDKTFKIEIPNISNGNKNNVAKDLNSGSAKNEAKDLSATVKVENSKGGKISPVGDLKPVVDDKPSADIAKTPDDAVLSEDNIERIKEENKSKTEPQDFTPPKDLEGKEIKAETDDKPLSSNDNKTIESEKVTDNSGAKDIAETDAKEEEKIDERPSIIDEASTKNNDTSKTSNKK